MGPPARNRCKRADKLLRKQRMLVTDDDRTLIVDRATLLGREPIPTLEPARPDPAVRVIVAYKLVRSALALLLGAGLAFVIATGRAIELQAHAAQLRQHLSSGFASALADAVLRGLVPSRLWLVVGALGLDSLISGIEGWAVARGRRWGTWLVVIATAALIPFEVAGLVRHVHAGRLLLLVLNVAVAGYLLRQALRPRS
jgi:uncharacterized membrane protein (DUF2068 family)